MTDTATIKTALAEIVSGMLAKGLRMPDVSYWIKANAQSYVYVNWKHPTKDDYGSVESKLFCADEFEDSHERARKWLSELPSREQRQFRDFTEQLAKTIELGKANGIEDGLVNPLEAAMKKLSRNALAAPVASAEEG